MKSVFVTGPTGFIGSRLVRKLLYDGIPVIALIREQSVLPPMLLPIPVGLELVQDDGSVDRIANAMIRHRTSVVVHCAAHYATTHTTADVVPMVQSNVLLGTRLAEATVKAGAGPLIVLGTMWENAGDLATAYHPANLYAATKRALQDILLFYAASTGLTVVVLQLGDTYGPGDTRNKLIPAMIRSMKEGTPLELSPGEQHLNLLHVDDVVAGIIHAALCAQSWPSGTFKQFALSAVTTISVRELVSAFERSMNQPLKVRWGARPYRLKEVMRPCSPHPVLPGWEQKVGLDEGLACIKEGIKQ